MPVTPPVVLRAKLAAESPTSPWLKVTVKVRSSALVGLAVGVVMARIAGGWTSTAPMSAFDPNTRTKVGPRWSVGRPAGLDPASISGLPARGAMVWVGPPLSASEPSIRLVPNGMLFAPVRVNPALSPTALKFTFTVAGTEDVGGLACWCSRTRRSSQR